MIAFGRRSTASRSTCARRGPESQRLVEYAIIENITHPLLDHVRTLSEGFSPLGGSNHGVDYIRSNLFPLRRI